MDQNSESGNMGEPSNKHVSGRIALATGMLMGGALLNSKDVSASTDYAKSLDNIPPVTQNLGDEGIYRSSGIEKINLSPSGKVLESSKEEKDSEIISPEDPRYLDFLRDALQREGKILIEDDPIPFEIVYPLGAYDKHGNYYPNAINKISIAGNEISLISGGYFSEMTFLHSFDDNRVGKILSMYWLEGQEGKSFQASPYLEPLVGEDGFEKTIYIDGRDTTASYGVILAIGSIGSSSVLPPEVYLDSNGIPRLVGESKGGFHISPSGYVGSDTGWVHGMIFKGYVRADGVYAIELLGATHRSEIAILPSKLDSKTASLESQNR